MKKLIIIIAIAALTSCVMPSRMAKIQMGWDKQQVEHLMGKPVEVSAQGHITAFRYLMFDEYYYVTFYDNKVASFGKLGDFNSTKNPTLDLNVTTKKRK